MSAGHAARLWRVLTAAAGHSRTRREGFRRTVQATDQLTAANQSRLPGLIAGALREQSAFSGWQQRGWGRGPWVWHAVAGFRDGGAFRNRAADGWQHQGRLGLTAAGPASDCWAWSPPCTATLSETRARRCQLPARSTVRPPRGPVVTVTQRRWSSPGLRPGGRPAAWRVCSPLQSALACASLCPRRSSSPGCWV